MGLFETTGTTYSELAEKYDNFMVPAMKITVDKTDTKQMSDIYISSLSIQLSLEQVCTASFTLEKVYDWESSSLQSEIKNKFQLGSIVTVELGYGSKTIKVFEGYIHELEYNFDEEVSIGVTALDMRRLMMMNSENRTFTEKSYSEILEEMISKYQNAFSSKSIDANTVKVTEVTQQGMSDYDFVTKELCLKDDKEFFVLSGTVYYKVKSADTSPVLTLKWGENLFSFRLNRTYHDEEISVYGLDGKNLVIGQETVETEGDMKKVSSSSLKKDIISPNVRDQKGAKVVAKNEAEKQKKKSRFGSGTCIGIPELVPGRYLEIEGLDVSGGNLKSVITEVRHTFGADGYTTEFELGG